MKKIRKITSFILILLLIGVWAYDYPPIPFVKNFKGQGWPGIEKAYALNILANPHFATDASSWTVTNGTGTDTCGVQTTTAQTSFSSLAYDGTDGNPSGSFQATSATGNFVRYKSYIKQSITAPGSGTVKIKGRFDYKLTGTTIRTSNPDGFIRVDVYDSANSTFVANLRCVQYAATDTSWTTATFGSDVSLTGGTTYTIRVTIAYRNASTNSVTVRVDNIINTFVSTGFAVTAPADTTNAQLDWTTSVAGSGANDLHATTPYKVYRNTISPVTTADFLANATTNSYTDTSTVGNTTYYYAISNVDTDSIESPLSAEASILTRPGTPTIGAFTNVLSTTLTTNWTAPIGGVSSYKVERCSGSGCTPSQIASGVTDIFYNDSGLTANTLYRYRIRATNATPADGAYSGIGEVTTLGGATQSLTFSISNNAIGFGTISASAARFANNASTGDTVEVEAHTLSASTNATSGYIITVQGATLTHTSNSSFTITAIGGTNTVSVPGTEQFGLRATVTSGTGTVTVPYAAAGFAYAADASTASQIASGVGDSASTIYSARYIANISASTEAGNYNTILMYIATATF